MRRGTTPTNIFKTKDISLVEASVLFVTYQQNGETIFEKTLEDCEITEEDVTVHLTQEETLALSNTQLVQIQIRVGFPDGSRLASNVVKAPAGKILKDGTI